MPGGIFSHPDGRRRRVHGPCSSDLGGLGDLRTTNRQDSTDAPAKDERVEVVT